MADEASPPALSEPRLTNREAQYKWAIDVSSNPYDIPLEQLDPSHPALVEHNCFAP